MNHVAVDLGGSKSFVCVRNNNSEILEEREVRTSALGAFLKRQPPSRVLLETCAEAFSVADEARLLGHDVRVIPATLVRGLGVGDRGIKTDARDARNISAASCRIDLPTVHIPSISARELKSMCSAREALVGTRTELINGVRGWFRTRRVTLKSGGAPTFPKRVRDKALDHSEGLPAYIERLLTIIDALNEQIREANEEIKAAADSNETCTLLMSMPGVGPVTAIRYFSLIDDVSRFGSAHEVESYIGLTPGEDSSSKRKRRTSITKAGSAKLRWVLTQAAWAMWLSRPNDPIVLWAKQVANRRGKSVAIIALARKMAGILYAMWRDKETYNPAHAAHSNTHKQPMT